MRGLSQNVSFMGDDAAGANDELTGFGLADQLAAALRQGGIVVSKPDNWRDSGWSFKAKVANLDEEIVVARAPTGAWFVQIGPARSPGLLRQLFGPREHSGVAETFEIARSIHRVLASDGRFSGFRWRWDGPPRADDAEEPTSRPAG